MHARVEQPTDVIHLRFADDFIWGHKSDQRNLHCAFNKKEHWNRERRAVQCTVFTGSVHTSKWPTTVGTLKNIVFQNWCSPWAVIHITTLTVFFIDRPGEIMTMFTQHAMLQSRFSILSLWGTQPHNWIVRGNPSSHSRVKKQQSFASSKNS